MATRGNKGNHCTSLLFESPAEAQTCSSDRLLMEDEAQQPSILTDSGKFPLKCRVSTIIREMPVSAVPPHPSFNTAQSKSGVSCNPVCCRIFVMMMHI